MTPLMTRPSPDHPWHRLRTAGERIVTACLVAWRGGEIHTGTPSGDRCPACEREVATRRSRTRTVDLKRNAAADAALDDMSRVRGAP